MSARTWVIIGFIALAVIAIIVLMSIFFTKEDTRECVGDGDCPSGSYCSGEQCISGCRSDSNCLDTEICRDGQCQTSCTSDAACQPGYICVSGVCSRGCRSSGECPQGMICVDGSCVIGCEVDGDCQEGLACYNHRCIVGCRSDIDCVGGVCNEQKQCTSITCITDSDCPEDWICDSTGVCQRLECHLDIDCLSGQCSNSLCVAPQPCPSSRCPSEQVCYLPSSLSQSGYCRPFLVDYGCYSSTTDPPFGFNIVGGYSAAALASNIISPQDLDDYVIASERAMMITMGSGLEYPFYLAVAFVRFPPALGGYDRIRVAWSNTPPATVLSAGLIEADPDSKYCTVINGSLTVGCLSWGEDSVPCHGAEINHWRIYQYFPSVYLTVLLGPSSGLLGNVYTCSNERAVDNLLVTSATSGGSGGSIINSVQGRCPSGGNLPRIGASSGSSTTLACSDSSLVGVQVSGNDANLSSISGLCSNGMTTPEIAGQISGALSSMSCPVTTSVTGYYGVTDSQNRITGIGLACSY